MRAERDSDTVAASKSACDVFFNSFEPEIATDRTQSLCEIFFKI